jgi:phosphoenolpyruvate synthase/pyruvate phosphate dikinase
MPKEIRKKALAFRKKGEKFFRNIQEVIEKSLRNLYPKEPNADEIAYEELVSQRVPSAETLAARQHLYVVAAGVVHPVTDLAPFLKKQGIVLDEGTATEGAVPAELKGSVASKGVARGRIRRVMRKKEISAFQDGEILVTSMTTPEFVPAMKKAAAIVTDEGGITCHAAIISRELGKPCIIGTKVATKVLKDGDEVEVDAEKGVVRVLAKRP